MHDFLHLLYHVVGLVASATPTPLPTPLPSPTLAPSGGGGGAIDNSVKVAIVTAIGVVLAAAVTAIASTFQRDRWPRVSPTHDNFTRQYIDNLLRDQRELRKLRETYNHLREGVIELGRDPDQIIAHQIQQNGGTP